MKHLLIALCAVLTMGLYSCSSQEEPLQPVNEQDETTFYTDHITPEEACRKAAKAMNHHFGKDLPQSRAMSGATARLYNGSRSGESNLYVVEYDEGGFAVVNANRDAAIDVFAVVPEGTFDTTENSGLEFYMNYADERAGGIPMRPEPLDTVSKVPSRELVEHKISARCEIPYKWKRGAPYNYQFRKRQSSNPLILNSAPMSIAMVVGYEASSIEFENGNEYLLIDGNWINLKEVSKTIAICSEDQNLLNEGEMDLQWFLSTISKHGDSYGEIVSYENFEAKFHSKYGYLFDEKNIYKFHPNVSYEELSNEFKAERPVIMYGQTGKDSTSDKDVWIIEQSKLLHYVYNLYAKDDYGNPKGPDTHEYEDWVYVNWALGGNGNGWYQLDYAMGFNDEESGQRTYYTYNFHFLTNLKFDVSSLKVYEE